MTAKRLWNIVSHASSHGCKLGGGAQELVPPLSFFLGGVSAPVSFPLPPDKGVGENMAFGHAVLLAILDGPVRNFLASPPSKEEAG